MNIPKTLENKIRILQFKLNEFVDSINLKIILKKKHLIVLKKTLQRELK